MQWIEENRGDFRHETNELCDFSEKYLKCCYFDKELARNALITTKFSCFHYLFIGDDLT